MIEAMRMISALKQIAVLAVVTFSPGAASKRAWSYSVQ